MHRFAAADGTMLAYSDEGTGLPVLCLAGLTRNSADFDYLAPHLGDMRLIRMDYRGRGRSDWPGPATYTIPHEAADAIALLDHLGIDRAAIIGTSRGGLIAMGLATSHKHRLRGVCLNDIGPDLAQGGLDAIMDYLGRQPRFATQAEMAAAMPGMHPGFRNVPDTRWVDEVRHRTRETPQGLRLAYDPALREAMLATLDQPQVDLWPFFDALKGLPLALIRGRSSDLLTRETVVTMRRRRPDMTLAEVPDRGHVPFLDEPEALAAIRAWLEKCK